MFELKRCPEFKKIVPIVVIAVLRGDDKVMAQTSQPVNQTPSQNAVPSIDPITALGYILAAGAAIFAVLPKLVEKWFGRVLDSKQSKDELQTLVLKNQAELELDQKQKELDTDNNLSNFYLETAKESQKSERQLLMTFVTNQLTTSQQKDSKLYDLIANQNKIISTLEKIEKSLLNNAEIQHDIMQFLKMHDQGG